MKAGETLSKIAGTYGTTVDALVEINAIQNKNLIRVGQVLMLQDTPQAAADKLEALGVELREHKSSFAVYLVLRALVITILVLQVLNPAEKGRADHHQGKATHGHSPGGRGRPGGRRRNQHPGLLAGQLRHIPLPGPAAVRPGRGCAIILRRTYTWKPLCSTFPWRCPPSCWRP